MKGLGSFFISRKIFVDKQFIFLEFLKREKKLLMFFLLLITIHGPSKQFVKRKKSSKSIHCPHIRIIFKIHATLQKCP